MKMINTLKCLFKKSNGPDECDETSIDEVDKFLQRMTILLLYHNTLSQSINNISIIYMGLLSQMYPKTRCTMISIINLAFRWKKRYTWPGLLVMLIYSYGCVIEFLFLPLLRKSFLVLLGIHASCRLGRCHSQSLRQKKL